MTLNDNFNHTYKVASTRLQLLSKMKSFTTVKASYAIYTSMIIPLLTYSCYPMSHSLQVFTTIWNVNVLTWWRSVWTKSLHLIYLIIISRWLIIQLTLGIISIVQDYLLQSLKLLGVASISQEVLFTTAYRLILGKLILSIFLRNTFLNSLNNIF